MSDIKHTNAADLHIGYIFFHNVVTNTYNMIYTLFVNISKYSVII